MDYQDLQGKEESRLTTVNFLTTFDYKSFVLYCDLHYVELHCFPKGLSGLPGDPGPTGVDGQQVGFILQQR